MVLLAFAEGGIQLLPNGTMLIHVVMILVMIAILNRTFFRPINQIIESRVKSKGGRFTEAEEIAGLAAEKESQFDAAMLAARSEGYELVEKERRSAVAQRDAQVREARGETSSFAETGHKEIEKQTEAARAALAEDAKKMAEQISSNILRSA